MCPSQQRPQGLPPLPAGPSSSPAPLLGPEITPWVLRAREQAQAPALTALCWEDWERSPQPLPSPARRSPSAAKRLPGTELPRSTL